MHYNPQNGSCPLPTSATPRGLSLFRVFQVIAPLLFLTSFNKNSYAVLVLWRLHFCWFQISGFDEFIFVVGLVFESLCGTVGARGDGRGGGAAEMDFLHSSIRPYQNWHPTRACLTTILFYHTKDFPVPRFSTTSELDHPQVKPPPQHVAQRCQKRDFKCEAVTMVVRPLKAVTSSHSLKANAPSPGNWRSNWHHKRQISLHK